MKPLHIDVLCNDGSPLGITLATLLGTDPHQIGCGGAELALMTLCQGWHDAGHKIRVYNTPRVINGSPFPQYPVDTFIPKEDRDILIIFRSPNPRILGAKGRKIWFSTDQYTVGDFREFAKEVDKIITISQFHANHFKSEYEIEETMVIDLPVRTWEYEQEVPKVKNSLLFCSVPDRGLEIMAKVYPNLKRQIPDLSLTITSDYRLWGVGHAGNEGYIRKFLGQDGVSFLGAVNRNDLVHEQQKAQIQSYPSVYPELFCYAVAECSVAGALPVTSDIGAISTTNMGVLVTGNPNSSEWQSVYVETIIRVLNSKDLPMIQKEVQEKAKSRFSLSRILKDWDERVFNG